VVPAETSAEDVFELKPDGVFLSNGPGDPEPVDYAVHAIRKFMGRVPVFGICLGHQLTGLALGGKTYKLKFGHHGGNHPVKNNATGKVEITAHNHQLCRRSRLNQCQRGRVDPRGPERPDAGRHAPSDAAVIYRPVPPRSRPRPARLELPLPRLPAHDGGVEGMKNWFPVLALFVGLGCFYFLSPQAEQEHQFSGPFDLYMKAEQQRSPDSVLRRFAADCGLDLQAALPHYAVLPGKNWVIVKDLEKGFEFQETDFISTTAVRKLGDLVVVETWSLSWTPAPSRGRSTASKT